MQPNGEHPNQPPDGRPPLPRQRPLDGPNPPIQRRPPLSRGSQPLPFARRLPVDPAPVRSVERVPAPAPPTAESNIEPAPVVSEPAEPQTEPVIQMPASHIPPPPVLATSEPAEQASDPIPAKPPVPAFAQEPSKSLNFTPPPKKSRSRFVYIGLAGLVFVVAAFGMFNFVKAQAAKNHPDQIMKDALDTNLSLTTLKSQSKMDGATGQTLYNFNDLKNPIMSTKTSLSMPKGTVAIDGYGTAKDSYVSYTALPKNVGSSVVSHTKNGWIQVRQDGVLPKGVNDVVVNLSDPRYQAFGPIMTGNFNDKTRQQLIDFLLAHKVYGYDAAKVSKVKVGDEKMVIYPLKVDVSYLKIASQSAAVNLGFNPEEIQAATDAMETLRGATNTLYIRASDHTIAQLKIVKDGKTKTIDYGEYGTASVPGAPQTKLTWQSFAPLQTQIESQTGLTKAAY